MFLSVFSFCFFFLFKGDCFTRCHISEQVGCILLTSHFYFNWVDFTLLEFIDFIIISDHVLFIHLFWGFLKELCNFVWKSTVEIKFIIIIIIKKKKRKTEFEV